MNKKGAIAIVAVIAIIVAGFIYVDNGGKIDFLGNYAFDVELEDPSFHVLDFNNTSLQHSGITNTSYNSTHITITLPYNWLDYSTPVYEIINNYYQPISFNLSDNFTNGALFTYLILPNGKYYYTGNVVHNFTAEIVNLSSNGTVTGYSIHIFHNITSDAGSSEQYDQTHPNTSVITLGDGLPVIDSTVHITLKPNYYVFIGLSSIKDYKLINYDFSSKEITQTGGIYI